VCAAFAAACTGSGKEPAHDSGGSAAPRVPHAVPQIVATCAELSGSGEARRKGEPTWEPIRVGATFRERDWVRSGGGSFVRLRFSDRRFIDMPEQTTILVDSEISIETGSLVAVSSGGEVLRVRAADGTVAEIVAGGDAPSELRITPSKSSGLEIAVTKGNVRVVAGADEQAIATGEASDVANNRASASVKLPPSPAELSSKDLVQLKPAAVVALSWGRVAGAARYRLQVARDPAFRDLLDDRELAETNASFTPEIPGEYVWRVASIDPQGRIGAYGGARTVRVEPEPPPDLLLSPVSGAKIGFADRSPTVAFTWRPTGKGMRYRLVVVQGTDLGAEPVATVATKATRAEVRTLREGTYHWGVYAVSDAGETPLFPAPRTLTIRKQRVKVHTEKLWQSPR